MKRNALKVGGFLALTAIVAIGTTSSAEAAISLRLTQGATVVNVSDNGAGDLSPLADKILFDGAVGVFNLNTTTGLSTPLTTLPEILHLNSVDHSTAAGTLKLEFTATDLDLATLNMIMALGPLLAPNASIQYQAYYDATNVAFGQGTLIGTLNGAGAVSGPVDGTIPYSLTQVVTLTHTGAGQSSFDANISVPEPASMSLLGLGLAGLAAFRRRRAARS